MFYLLEDFEGHKYLINLNNVSYVNKCRGFLYITFNDSKLYLTINSDTWEKEEKLKKIFEELLQKTGIEEG